MQHDLPSFDTLLKMAQDDPEALERLRVEMCEQVILDAPESHRRKLRGLQFRIDMERRKAKSPMAACINISGMMHESFERLRETLNEATGTEPSTPYNTSDLENSPLKASSKVLPFRRA